MSQNVQSPTTINFDGFQSTKNLEVAGAERNWLSLEGVVGQVLAFFGNWNCSEFSIMSKVLRTCSHSSSTYLTSQDAVIVTNSLAIVSFNRHPGHVSSCQVTLSLRNQQRR